MAIQRLTDSVRRLGDDLGSAADLRGRIRRHPLLATGLGAFLGFVGGPLIPSAFRRVLPTMSMVSKSVAQRQHGLPALAKAALRAFRGGA